MGKWQTRIRNSVVQRIPPNLDIFVYAFVAGSPGSEAAQHIYMSFGFEPIGVVEIEGSPRDRFLRRAVR